MNSILLVRLKNDWEMGIKMMLSILQSARILKTTTSIIIIH